MHQTTYGIECTTAVVKSAMVLEREIAQWAHLEGSIRQS